MSEFEEYFRKYPFTMVDIGASGGAVKEWERLGKYVKIVGFEPDERAYADLVKEKNTGRDIKYLNTLVHKEYNPKAKFNLYKGQQLSSIFFPNVDILSRFGKTDAWEIARSIEVEVDSLDNQLRKNNINDIDFIKLDTQGSELMVLEGAVKTLEGPIFGIHVEIEFNPVYKDQPLFSDVDIFLRKHGFQLFEIMRSKYWKQPIDDKFVKSNGQIMYGDMLYLRDFEHFDGMLKVRPDKYFRKSKLLKAAAISALYGHMDYAFEMLRNGMRAGLFDDREKMALSRGMDRQKQFHIDLAKRLPDFKGKGTLVKWSGALCRVFKKKEDRWIGGAIWK